MHSSKSTETDTKISSKSTETDTKELVSNSLFGREKKIPLKGKLIKMEPNKAMHKSQPQEENEPLGMKLHPHDMQHYSQLHNS